MDSYTRAAVGASRVTAAPTWGARIENAALMSAAVGYALFHYYDLARAAVVALW